MIVDIQARAFSSNKLQLFSYTILDDYRFLESLFGLVEIVCADPPLRYSSMLLGRLSKQPQPLTGSFPFDVKLCWLGKRSFFDAEAASEVSNATGTLISRFKKKVLFSPSLCLINFRDVNSC